MIEILMATFNSSRYLDAQLDSLFQQTYPHFTLTIRDNRSTDHTRAMLAKWHARYPGRIRLYCADEHGDALSNFSTLLTLSQGNYLAFSDSDDIWLPHKLEQSMQQLQVLETHHGQKTPCLIYTDLIPTDATLRPLCASFWKDSGLPAQVPKFSEQLMRNRLTGCTLLFNRALATLADPIPKEALMHDAWLGAVATAFGAIDLVQSPTVLYRQHASNQLGHVPINPLQLIRSGKFAAIWQRRLKTHGRFKQAEQFLHRYEKELSPLQRQILEDFLMLPQSNWINRLRLMQRHQFYEPTWAWTLYTLIFRLTA